MKKIMIIWVTFTCCLTACKSDEIQLIPKKDSVNEKIHRLLTKNQLPKFSTSINNPDEVIYLVGTEAEYQFLKTFTTKNELKSGSRNILLTESKLQKGIFTFRNSQIATLYFDDNGQIISLNVDGDENLTYSYDVSTGFLEIFKWGVIGIPSEIEYGSNQLITYQYHQVPTIRWYAHLRDSYWSGVQFLNMPEGANFEGEGSFEMLYNPVIDPLFPRDLQF